MIVIDVGCKSYEREESIQKLVDRFKPTILYGFDPNPELEEGVRWSGRSLVVTRRMAAWTRDGSLPFIFDGTRSRKTDGFVAEAEYVRCFDLVGWLATLPLAVPKVLKLDVEGAEYELLRDLKRRGEDRRSDLLVLVEWHAAGRVELHCPVEEWDMDERPSLRLLSS